MSLDHGILNTPLASRGDIDKQIDKYKAEKAKEDRKEVNDRKFLYDERDKIAKEMYANLTRDQIKHFANKIGVSLKDARIELKYGSPERRIKLYKWIIK